MKANFEEVAVLIPRLALVTLQDLLSLDNFPSDRNNGYLTVRRKADARILQITQIGECSAEKAQDYLSFSQEKGLRLSQYKHDVSSWQSREEAQKMYGGAIVAGEYILSFSGLPEWGDEALVLFVALFFGWIGMKEALEIAQISKNAFFFDVLAKTSFAP